LLKLIVRITRMFGWCGFKRSDLL